MILSTKLDEMAAILADTPDDLLPLFSPLDRAIIIAIKEMRKIKPLEQ
jgi:hypothetical protein